MVILGMYIMTIGHCSCRVGHIGHMLMIRGITTVGTIVHVGTTPGVGMILGGEHTIGDGIIRFIGDGIVRAMADGVMLIIIFMEQVGDMDMHPDSIRWPEVEETTSHQLRIV